jgi:NAD(P)-dependent dehydrogenase (short-subunit alcohol dehydrogenase family)
MRAVVIADAAVVLSRPNVSFQGLDTPMTSRIFGPGMEQVGADPHPRARLHRFGQPEEIASVASFLLSADPSFVTRHAIAVPGGHTAARDHGVTKLLGLEGP